MVQILKARKRDVKEIDVVLHPIVKKWFFDKFEDFSLTQRYGVLNVWERKNTLISAPTGGTKTLTSFLSILNYLVMLAEKNELEDKIYAVYASPLKALGNDIRKNLEEPLAEIGKIAEGMGIQLQKIRIGLRTGDTSTSERVKMARKTPHILVTTPESLSIVLTTKKFVDNLRAVEFVIIDEIHSLDNKRGAYLSLSLERLNEISGIWPVKIGLSATISPLDEVARFLVGHGDDRSVEIAKVELDKKIDVKVLSPVGDLIEDENAYSEMYELMNKLILEHKTTLVFTNTRAGTERVVNHLKEKFPTEYGEDIAAHHGSLSKDMRFNIEERLRNGKLKVVVCSTSLELGIDIGFIDLVIMLGSPKSSARALQRCFSYNSNVLCSDGKYLPIGKIVEKNLDVDIISYDKQKGFVKNKITNYHKNKSSKLVNIELECGENIECTENHPILTNNGWKKAKTLELGDFVAELKSNILFDKKEPFIYELVPKNKIFVANVDNFFQKIVKNKMDNDNLNCKYFCEVLKMPYARFIDCRRLKGRKKSIRLDYFLEACCKCNIEKEKYLPYLSNLKTAGNYWTKFPLKLTKEIMWLAGIVATDGCIVKSKKGHEAEYYKIKIGNKSRIMINKIKEIVSNYQINPYVKYFNKEKFYQLEFGSNIFAYIFMALGIPCKNKTFNIEMNNNVYSLGNELIYAYLEGIFEGDGNFNLSKTKTSGMMRIFTASKKFANGLHNIFSRLGYQNKISKNNIKTSKLIKKANTDKYLYCVGVYAKEHLRDFFMKTPCYGEKARKAKEFSKNFGNYISEKNNYNPFISYSKIKKILFQKNNKYVYNLTMKNHPNNYIVGNVIVHNCGRAGHKLHETAKGRFIVTERDDLVECAVIQKEMVEGKINKIKFPRNCLDVLAQQIYGMCIYKVWNIDEILEVIRKSYCFHDLSREDFMSVISYLTGEYGLEKNYVYAKIWFDEETRQIGKKGKLARVIYMTNIGTIPEESYVTVKLAPEGSIIGVIDESFLSRMKKGDVFVLGGQKYIYCYTKGMNLYVRGAGGRSPTIPSWFSEMLPLSFDSALEIGRFRKLVNDKFEAKKSKGEIIEFIKEHLYVPENTAKTIYDYLDEQYRLLGLPHSGKIIVERFKSRKKNYVVVHSMYGRRVNDALSRALAYLMAQVGKRDIEIGISDNGFYFSGEKMQIENAVKFLNSGNLDEVLKEAVNRTDVLARRFRHCAGRALMILRNYKGRQKSVGKQQMRSHFLLASIRKISTEFPILREARREVLEDLMDIDNCKKVLDMIKSGVIKIKFMESKIASPFALGLIIQGHADLIKIEAKQDFLKRMHRKHLDMIKK